MRKIFEELIFVGRIEKEYDLYGHKWLLATLTTEEQVDATASTGNFDNIARVNAIKMQFLSKSLKSIDGNKLLDQNEALELLGKMQYPLLNSLFEKFEELQNEQDLTLKELDEIKNS
jgi:hypothetical protein